MDLRSSTVWIHVVPTETPSRHIDLRADWFCHSGWLRGRTLLGPLKDLQYLSGITRQLLGPLKDLQYLSGITRQLLGPLKDLQYFFGITLWEGQRCALGPGQRSGQLTDLPPEVRLGVVLHHAPHRLLLPVAPPPPAEHQQVPGRRRRHPVVEGAGEERPEAGPAVGARVVPLDVAERLVHPQEGEDEAAGRRQPVAEPADGRGRSLLPGSAPEVPEHDVPAALAALVLVARTSARHVDAAAERRAGVAVKGAGHRRSPPPRSLGHVVELDGRRGRARATPPDGVDGVLHHAAGEPLPPLQHGRHRLPAVEAGVVAPRPIGRRPGEGGLLPLLVSLARFLPADDEEEAAHRAHAVVPQAPRDAGAHGGELPAPEVERQHLPLRPIGARPSAHQQHAGRRPERRLSALSDRLSRARPVVLQRPGHLASDEGRGHGAVGGAERGELSGGDQSEAQMTQQEVGFQEREGPVLVQPIQSQLDELRLLHAGHLVGGERRRQRPRVQPQEVAPAFPQQRPHLGGDGAIGGGEGVREGVALRQASAVKPSVTKRSQIETAASTCR
ncbi:hypothetical protein EYF80_051073 [Liparis tanakae]|uniref:Uncharacterized protein n=1 Tax=Liparis tanakae TaxID=230148 RepID=A0A4Z2FCS6_9TELE|nr:hypothetical protein EYF80_051073 [Liparis tanakae]